MDAWQRLGLAVGRPIQITVQRDVAGETADGGHLAMQELVLRLGRRGGYVGSFELTTKPSEPWRSADVGLADPAHRRLIHVECWNTIGDIGAAARSSARKQAELADLGVARWGVGATTGLVWVVRATARNRALIARYPEVFASRFPGSSRGCVEALTLGVSRRTSPASSGATSRRRESSPGVAAPDRLNQVNHADHVRLIRDGVEGAGPRWLELGAGEGAFTLALADVLGPGGEILALDRDRSALRRLEEEMGSRFPGAVLRTTVGDFRHALPAGPFDGILAANSLHFATDPAAILGRAGSELRPGGRVVVVEYDADRGNPWVPHPFSAGRFPVIAAAAGLTNAREIGRAPSRFLGAIYAAAADAVLHSRPYGLDREE